MILRNIDFNGIKKSRFPGYISKKSLSGIDLNETLKYLEPLQSKFLERYINDIPREYKANWPIDKLHWWSRPEEYAFIISNILNFLKSKDREINVLEFGPGCSFVPYLVNDLLDQKDNFYIEDIDNSVIYFWKKLMLTYGREVMEHNSITTQKSQYFDLIYSISVLEHIKNPSNAIEKLADQLRPGGRLLMTLDVDLTDTGKHGLIIEDLRKIFSIKDLEFDPIPSLHAILHLSDIATAKNGWCVGEKNNTSILNILKDKFKKNKDNPKNIAVVKLLCTKI